MARFRHAITNVLLLVAALTALFGALPSACSQDCQTSADPGRVMTCHCTCHMPVEPPAALPLPGIPAHVRVTLATTLPAPSTVPNLLEPPPRS